MGGRAKRRVKPRRVTAWTGGAIALITVLTIVAFAPALDNEFVDWDDYQNLTRNERIRGFSPENLKWMLTATHLGVWQPTSWFVTALEYDIFDGADERSFSRGMHGANIALHVVASLLLFFLIRSLLTAGAGKRRTPPAPALDMAAATGALFFAVHPLRVELIGWATGQPYILALIFTLASTTTYIRAVTGGGRHWFIASVVLFALSLTCKSIAVPLFLVFLLLDWYPLRRIAGGAKPVLVEKIPYALLALAIVIVAPLAKEGASSTMSLAIHGPMQRAAQACYGLVFYAWKTIAPVRLSPIYELRLPLVIGEPRYVVSIVVVLFAGAMLFLFGRRRAKGVTTAIAAYTIFLLPVLGFLQSGNQEVADRYAYLPSVAWSVLAAAGLYRLIRHGSRGRRAGVSATVLLLAASIILIPITREQCRVWRDTASLWTRAAELQDESSVAQNGYGYVLLQEGRTDEAIARFRRSIAIKGDNDMAHRNLWSACREAGRTDDLILALKESIALFPGMADANHHLGNVYARQKRYDDAIASFRAAIAIDPRFVFSHRSLAGVLYTTGDRKGAIRHARTAIEIDPTLADARRVLAASLRSEGNGGEAVQILEEGLRIDPADSDTRRLMESWKEPAGTAR